MLRFIGTFVLAGLSFAGVAQAQSMQGRWEYLLLTTDGVNTGTLEIDASGRARASGKISTTDYKQSGTASQNGNSVDIQFTEAQASRPSVQYSPDHFICQFNSANLMDCTLPHPSGLATHAGHGQVARAGSQEAAALGKTPTAVEGQYYTDRRSGCRLWTRSFHADATVQWSGACRGGFADGPGVLTLTHSVPNEDGDVELRIEGQYVAGKLNGRALVTYNGGARFEGDMRDGVRHGQGRFTQSGIGYYQGDYRDGLPFGHGVAVSYGDCRAPCEMPAARYEGEFVNFKFQGAGVFTKGNGDKYEGQWGNGLPNGAGTFTWDNGRKSYSGKWSSGCSLSPQGTLY